MKPYGMYGKKRSTCEYGCCHDHEKMNPLRKTFYLVKRALKKKARREGKSQTKEVDLD